MDPHTGSGCTWAPGASAPPDPILAQHRSKGQTRNDLPRGRLAAILVIFAVFAPSPSTPRPGFGPTIAKRAYIKPSRPHTSPNAFAVFPVRPYTSFVFVPNPGLGILDI